IQVKSTCPYFTSNTKDPSQVYLPVFHFQQLSNEEKQRLFQ
ncbi:10058_t:CDS:1, partial [Racocetra fulgida]